MSTWTALDGRIYLPQEGSYFARLSAGAGTGSYTLLTQTFSLGQGDLLTGWSAFDGRDYLPYNDDAFASISFGLASITLFWKDISAVGNNSSSPWQQWNFVAPSGGDYTLTYGVRNHLDNSQGSYALFDTSVQSASVPDAGSTLVLLSSVLAGFGIARRKFLAS